MIINRIYEPENLLSLWHVFFLVGLRTYQHPCMSVVWEKCQELLPDVKYPGLKLYTDMRRLTTGIRSEKCVVRRFRRCANVIQCQSILFTN